MITIDKENFIRALLLKGKTTKEICYMSSVSRRTVYLVKSAPKGIDRTNLQLHHGEIMSLKKEEKILELLTEGVKPQTQIARLMGCSLQSVYRIKKRGVVRGRKLKEGEKRYARTSLVENHKREEGEHLKIRHFYDGKLGERKVETKRCPECGGLVVIWPCILCNPNEGCY